MVVVARCVLLIADSFVGLCCWLLLCVADRCLFAVDCCCLSLLAACCLVVVCHCNV